MADCLSDDELAALIELRLPGEAVHAVTLHLDACSDCRQLVAAAVRSLEPDALEGAESTHGAPLPRGAAVGRYVVRNCIGAGAMGIVYTARDPDLGRNVALKLLRPDPTTPAPAEARARLLREAQAMAKVSHPNVITIHDVGTIDEEVFLAMELVEGGTLVEWLQGKHPWRAIVAVVRHAGEGLAAAHAAGLVHRDFKPDNVLVGRDGRVRVTDFGLARSVEGAALAAREGGDEAPDAATATMTQTNTVAGTPAYMAPELLAGHAASVHSDIFSFCAAFYEALYGERPFAGATLLELAANIRAGRVRPAPSGSRVPTALRRALLRGLEASPERRPPTVRALVASVDAATARSPARTAALIALGVLVVGAGVVAARATRARAAPIGTGASSVVAPRPTAVTDLPMPPSSNADALRAYARGLQGMRDGSWGATEFEQATQLDPSMAAAHLRYAMLQFWQMPTEARAHLAKAIAGQSSLTDHDRAILRAAETWMQSDPSDDAGYARVVDEARTRYPEDAELAFYAGFAQTQVADHAEAVVRFEQAIALDPGFGAAYQLEADEKAYAGDIDGALATLETCVDKVPEATRCLMERSLIDEAEGNCARVEQDGHRMQAHDPDTDMSYAMLAAAAYAQGKRMDVVRELLRENELHAPPVFRRRFELKHAYLLATLSGDFDEARRSAIELGEANGVSPDRRFRLQGALLSADTALEEGDPVGAARIARDFLERQDAWASEPRSDDFAVLRDSTPSLWIAERTGGLLSPADFERQRDTWVRGWEERLPPAHRPYAWVHGYARVATTRDDAVRALAVLGRFGTPPRFTPLTFGDGFVGRTYLLAGRPEEALPFLQRAARSCLAIDQPLDQTQSELLFGDALVAAKGAADPQAKEQACAAYGTVQSRWGHAKPRSVTAELARAHAAQIGCR